VRVTVDTSVAIVLAVLLGTGKLVLPVLKG
jgi:hypothetical protein